MPVLVDAQSVLVRGVRETGRSVPLSDTIVDRGVGTVLAVHLPTAIAKQHRTHPPEPAGTYRPPTDIFNAFGRVSLVATAHDLPDARRQEAPSLVQLRTMLSDEDNDSLNRDYERSRYDIERAGRYPPPPPMDARLFLLAAEETIRNELIKSNERRTWRSYDRRDRQQTVLDRLRRPLGPATFDLIYSALERIEEPTLVVERQRDFASSFAEAMRSGPVPLATAGAR